jgi:soluble lytic murein transglycosylase
LAHVLIRSACIAVFTFWLSPPLLYAGAAWAQTESNLLSHEDRALYCKAFQAAKKNDWRGAHRLARKAEDPLPAKALRWLNYRQPGNRASFDEIATFLQTNPTWPSRDRLIRRAEEAMEISRIADPIALKWFTLHRPLSGPGQIRLAEAMLRNGMHEDGQQWLRYAWTNNVFARRISKALYRRHRKILTKADHMARLDHMLWKGHRYSARRLYTLVPKSYRKLAEARESLMVRGPGVDSKIAAVPKEFLNNSGLAYERLRWRRRKSLDERARDILLQPPPNLGPRPEKWWLERHIQTRGALREGKADLAYRLASEHGQLSGTFSYAQAEWLSGWIALRYLTDASTALGHFGNLYGLVKFPVSRARAAYWAGRANMALGNKKDGTKWYRAAAKHPSTYYGQLATEALGSEIRWRMPKQPSPSTAANRRFNDRELVRLSRMLLELKQEEHLRPIILHLTRTATSPDGRLQAARLSQGLGQSTLAVRAAKLALRSNTLLPRIGYPVLSDPAPMSIEPALAHAVARQESEFNPTAVSHASARGLMQLLPRTARKVAKSLRLRYRQDRLFDPRYNMRLGAAYLGQLIKAYRGSYIMALAAYNAGPKRVNRWRRQNGDPRRGDIDPIDWVEAISISETRNYVQRVMENLQVYRWRFNPQSAKLTLNQDLHRTSIRRK